MRRIFLVLALLALSTSARAQGVYTPEMSEWASQAGRMLHGYHAALDVAAAAVRERSGARELPPLHAGGGTKMAGRSASGRWRGIRRS